MYLLGAISLTYLWTANKYHSGTIELKKIGNVLSNVLIAELMYFLMWMYMNMADKYNFWSVVYVMLLQDVYYYTVHTAFHKFQWMFEYHKIHHSEHDAFYAWYMSTFEFLILHIGSLFVPLYYVRITSSELLFLIIGCTYLSVGRNTTWSNHYEHHINPYRRRGTLYVMDYLFGSA